MSFPSLQLSQIIEDDLKKNRLQKNSKKDVYKMLNE